MNMDRDWNALVEEGKEIIGRKSKDQWRLGALAAQVKKDYGKGGLERYAKEIGENYNTLQVYRATFLAWPDKNLRPRRFSTAHDLAAHPDRVKIIQDNPDIAGYEVRVVMKDWRDGKPHGSSKKKTPESYAGPLARRHIEREIERRTQDQVEDWMNRFRPHLEDARAVKAGRKGLITAEESKIIFRCLHPDNSASLEMRNKAFLIWQRIGHLLMSEQDAPTVIDLEMRRKRRSA
jgi:hypothetical protein